MDEKRAAHLGGTARPDGSGVGPRRARVRYDPRVIRAVVFDLMDTVLRDPYREAIEAATGLPLADAVKLRDPRCWPEFEVAAIDEAEFARRFFGDGTEARFDMAAFHRARHAWYAFLPGVRAILRALRGRVPTYLASNYPIWIEELRVTHALDALFDGVFASHQLRVRKPAAAFYARMLDAIALPPEEILFVDDRAANCEAAERAGMQAHHFVDAEGLRAHLVAEGVLADAEPHDYDRESR
jgi:HAD superfamily hydrolase (TIGR01509 family)